MREAFSALINALLGAVIGILAGFFSIIAGIIRLISFIVIAIVGTVAGIFAAPFVLIFGKKDRAYKNSPEGIREELEKGIREYQAEQKKNAHKNNDVGK